jgi:hypothetical protein
VAETIAAIFWLMVQPRSNVAPQPAEIAVDTDPDLAKV